MNLLPRWEFPPGRFYVLPEFCFPLWGHRLFHTSEYEVVLMEHFENTVILRGELQELPRFSHENHRKRFFRFTLCVPRLSGNADYLPIVAEEAVLNCLDLSGGEMLRIEGQIRSHNLREEGVRRLLIFVYATAITAEDGDPVNDVILRGPLCRDPICRRTPLGRDICDIMLAVPRAYRRADYLPCILWGRTAHELAQCRTSDQIRICGRLQSRVYTKQTESGPQERTAYEISALTAEIIDDCL
ncbi:MAG: single-stranded DNA-binding protein [Ruminococcaceae bacterium]|nr:single-stranded DNA-binding protein [Oscillospiraceae bacterium]